MIITAKELQLINTSPQKYRPIYEELINKSIKNLDNTFLIPEDYLKYNNNIREHLRQIIGR